MIYRGTKIWLKDNSGIMGVKCLQLYPTFIKKGLFGNVSLVTLFRYKRLKKATKRKTYLVLIMTIKRKFFRKAGGYFIKFCQNTGLLLNNDQEKFIGTVFNVPITRELRQTTSIRLLRVSRILV